MIIKNVANIITFSRLVGSIILFFIPSLSTAFFYIYSYCGLSDVLDGFIARRTHSESKLGSVLDSISDLSFYSIMMIKMMPYLRKYLPKYIWVMIWIVLSIRLVMYSFIAIRDHKVLSNHTILNKATGFCLFFLPFIVLSEYLEPYGLGVCILSFISAFYEITLINKKIIQQ